MNNQVFERAKRRDTIARYFIIGSGGAVIFCVVGIFFLIGWVALPLFLPPSQKVIAQMALPSTSKSLALALDEYLELAAVINQDGKVVFYNLASKDEVSQRQLASPQGGNATIQSVVEQSNFKYSLLWSDGSTSVIQIKFLPEFTASGRKMKLEVLDLAEFPAPAEGMPLRSMANVVVQEEEGSQVTLVQQFDNSVKVVHEITTQDFLGNEETESSETTINLDVPAKLTQLVIDGVGRFLYGSTDKGHLLRWSLQEPGEAELLDQITAFEDGQAITSLALIFGDASIAVGSEKGDLSTWFPIPVPDRDQKRLTRIHQMTDHKESVRTIQPSMMDKSLISLDQSGVLHWDHMTSERQLLSFTGSSPYQLYKTSGRGNGLIALDNNQQLTVWEVKNPHPEISWGTLFGEVFYEGYESSSFTWQSSSASDDFEPKFSLVPLIFGSLKGTFYAMIFAVPIALLGAIYISQFAHENFRKFIKPGVEIMAAMPSVIIGFLIALWLAPIVEEYIISFFLALAFIPIVILAFVVLWYFIRENQWARHVELGYEFSFTIPVIIIACALSVIFQGPVESALFNGDFQQWMYEELGSRYDQRNSIIIAFGLGFMVIPIIFTMSDDALTNVPESFKAASLALGASRWQTVWRVIIPSASPGIFAACIIGFGRAVGETMVVLMATGNTPIIDWSIFNGMRTLSANIAVELPEAPVDGTLYRILFLSAVILFLITSVLNTVAELVRQRLRKKYGQF